MSQALSQSTKQGSASELREQTEMIEWAELDWCPGPELNRYVPFGTRDFKSRASASFATRALGAIKLILASLVCIVETRLLVR